MTPENDYNYNAFHIRRQLRRTLTLTLFRILLRRFPLLFFALHLVIFQHLPAGASELQEARVSNVHDGDTVTLRINNRMLKTRLIGIDAPEMGQRPWGKRSKEHLISIMTQNDWTVLVETDVVKQDKFNRPLAYLFTRSSEFINERMVLDGYAVLFTIPPNVKYAERFSRAQQAARSAGAGIWGPRGLKEQPVKWREKHPRNNPNMHQD